MRFLTNEGIYVVKFNGDTLVACGTSQIILRHLPEIGAGNEIPDEIYEKSKDVTPHTILDFEKVESIDILIEALIILKERLVISKEQSLGEV